MAEKTPIFITRELLEDVASAEILRDALLEVANEHGVEVYPRRAPNRLLDHELRDPGPDASEGAEPR